MARVRRWMVLLLFVPSVAFAGSGGITLRHNKAIIVAQEAVYRDVNWLEKHFDGQPTGRGWAVLADLHMQCKWLERHYRSGPISWCFISSPGTKKTKWVNYLVHHRSHFSGMEIMKYMKEKLKLFRTE